MLRNGIPADAEGIERVRIAAWRSAYQGFMPPEFLSNLDEKKNVGRLRKRLASEDINLSLTVAEDGAEIVAFSILGGPRYEAPETAVESYWVCHP